MSKSREGYFDYLFATNAIVGNLTGNIAIKSYTGSGLLMPVEKEGTLIFLENPGQIYVSTDSMWISTAGMSGLTSVNGQTGPAITIAGGNSITANTTPNTITLDLDPVNLATNV